MDGEEFFFHVGGQGKAKNLRGGTRKGSKSAGRSTYCIYRLIEIICYSRGNLDLDCIPELSTTYCKSFVSVSAFIVTTLFSLAMSGVEVSIQ